MKKMTKGLLIVSLLLVLIGTGCIGAGCIMGIDQKDIQNMIEQYVPYEWLEEIDEVENTPLMR